MTALSHVDPEGRANMVDVSAKAPTARTATATGRVLMSAEALGLVAANALAKGDVLGTARLAGIMAAKRAADLIPLCHPLPLDAITVDCLVDPELPGVRVEATVGATARTGVEMEALTAVSVACLTVYDMVKAVDRHMTIDAISVRGKQGGRHDWSADAPSSGDTA